MIGELNRQIAIEQRGATRDTDGGVANTWSTVLAACWAAIAPLKGRELIAAKAQQSEITHTVTIRYRTTIEPGMRVVFQGRYLHIAAITDPLEDHTYLQLHCSEGLKDAS